MDYKQVDINTVLDLIDQHIRHPYLIKHIQKPVVDEEKLMVLLTMLNEQEIAADKIEKYALTTMLVQIALDTHELVCNEDLNQADYQLQKERQLTVLGGIYYSSLYYKILAEMENINLTRELSIGIKTVNEHKMVVYRESAKTVDQLMDSVKKIESAIFSSVSDYFETKKWKSIMQNMLFINRLINEKKTLKVNKTTPFLNNLKKIVFPNEKLSINEMSEEKQLQIVKLCNEYINEASDRLSAALKKLPNIQPEFKKSALTTASNYCSTGKTSVGEW